MNRIWQKFPFKMDPKNKYLFSLSLFFCLPVWGIADQGKAPNAKEIIDAHIRCRKMIQTLSCSVKQNARQLNQKGEYEVLEKDEFLDYWYNTEFVLLKKKEDGKENITVWHKNEVKNLSNRPNNSKLMWGANRSSLEEPYWDRADPFFVSNFGIVPPGETTSVRLESLLRLATEEPKVIAGAGPDTPVLRLVIPYHGGKRDLKDYLDLHFNKKKNYIIEKVEYRGKPSSLPSRVHLIEEFHEPVPGIFFAKSAKIMSMNIENKPSTIIESTVSDLVINEPIDSSLFDLQFPNNIIMNDSINRSRYRIDESGNQISKPLDIPFGPPQAKGSKPPQAQTKSESYLGYLWLPGIGLILIGVGLALYFFKGKYT